MRQDGLVLLMPIHLHELEVLLEYSLLYLLQSLLFYHFSLLQLVVVLLLLFHFPEFLFFQYFQPTCFQGLPNDHL